MPGINLTDVARLVYNELDHNKEPPLPIIDTEDHLHTEEWNNAVGNGITSAMMAVLGISMAFFGLCIFLIVSVRKSLLGGSS